MPVTLPASLYYISLGAFSDCGSLAVVTIMTDRASGYPEWSQNYVAFIAPTIMTDISTENYGTASNRGLIAQSLYNMLGNGAVATALLMVEIMIQRLRGVKKIL